MRSSINSNGGSGNWLGVQEITFHGVEDHSSKYDWADVYLVCEFTTPTSKFPRIMKIYGDFEKNPDGTIQDGKLLKKITYLFDALGEQGGVNQYGKWCDENENEISDICAHLTSKYKDVKCTGYVFEELAKNGKTYTRLHHYCKPGFDEKSKKDVESYMDYMRRKGYLKEPSNNPTTASQVTVDANGIDIANL
tara:strand:+ start:1339 stop:1917 length:579 start_codon:yes stop_codon:yes gene_type:complete